MNKYVSDIFAFVLGLCHIIFIFGLLIFVIFGGEFGFYDNGMRVILAVSIFIAYSVIFGAITTLVAIKDELIEANRKMAIFFDVIDKEIEGNKKNTNEKVVEVTKDATNASD